MRPKRPRRQTLALFLLASGLAAGVGVAGLGCSGSGGGGTGNLSSSVTTENTVEAESETTQPALVPGEHLRDAKAVLVQLLGISAEDLEVSTAPRESPDADVMLEWEGGKAEVDSSTGRIYVVSATAPGGSIAVPMTAPKLEAEARRIAADLGWSSDMLAGMGFQKRQIGSLSSATGLYTTSWSAYDSEDIPMDGLAEVILDGRTGSLVRFSLSRGSTGIAVAGALGEEEAMDIAETCIYLRSNKVKIPLAVDGSLILLGKSVSEELKTVNDQEITRGKPVLAWVITVTGRVGENKVGGTVYIDASTGKILRYIAAPTE